jgi:hypothetical protein
MMGLEKLLRGLYGSAPQIDMDRQIARARVPAPMPLDFAALADGIKRNNVGTAAIVVEASVEVRGVEVVLQPTGQSFPLAGPPPAEGGSARRRLRVLDWEDPAKTRIEVLH